MRKAIDTRTPDHSNIIKKSLRMDMNPDMSKMIQFVKSHQEFRELSGKALIDALFAEMNIEVKLEGAGLKNIPSVGAFICIANHPFSILDELLMLKMILEKRPDFKIMGSAEVAKISEFSKYLFHPRGTKGNVDIDLNYLDQHLKNDNPIGFFPAVISTLKHRNKLTSLGEQKWRSEIIKFVQESVTPIVPMYIQGIGSLKSTFMGFLSQRLKKTNGIAETLKRQHDKISIRIGSPILPKEYKKIKNTERLGRYLKAKTYSLGSGLEIRNFYKEKKGASKKDTQQPIAAPQDAIDLRNDISLLPDNQKLYSLKEFDVFLANAPQIPHILQEIGRLREITFRSVGEGTGNSKDLDEYDLYYHHLFLWDREAEKLVGSYRLGLGASIYEQFGKRGFYTHSLFKMKKKFKPILEKSVELGRSFICEEYQRHRMPLYLLWKGIYRVLEEYPEYRYLLGPVSISNDYTSFSRNFIVAFIKKYYFDAKLAKYVKPRTKFRPDKFDFDMSSLIESTESDLRKADSIISDIEPLHIKLPVLLKKYIKQNASIIAFNLDPNFNDCLDGLIVSDIRKLPDATLDRMKRE